MLPLQPGIPGGPELLVLLLIFLLPLVLIVVLLGLTRRSSDGGGSGGKRDRLDEVERRLGRLEARVDDLEPGGGGGVSVGAREAPDGAEDGNDDTQA